MVWGRHWLVVLLPICSLVVMIGMVSSVIYTFYAYNITQPFM